MKKSIIIFIAILTLVSFGTVHSAHAFVEPISTIAFICGGIVFGFASIKDMITQPDTATAQIKDQKGNPVENNALKKIDEAQKTQDAGSLSNGQS